MAIDKNYLGEYLTNTKYIVLATVDSESAPALRTLGSFVVGDGYKTYFSTNKETAKVEQIEKNQNVSVLFQHENQELSSYYNVEIKGKAKKITEEAELNKVIELLGNKNPRFKERIAKNGLGSTMIFSIDPVQLKVVDFKKGSGGNRIEVIRL